MEDLESSSSSSPLLQQPRQLYLSKLNIVIFFDYVCSSACVASVIVSIPKIASDLSVSSGSPRMSSSQFASSAASLAVFGTASGKALTGVLGDSLGARRVIVTFFVALSLSLLLFSQAGERAKRASLDEDEKAVTTSVQTTIRATTNPFSPSSHGAASVFQVGLIDGMAEFFNGAMWPSMTIILATHYTGDVTRLEAGLIVLSLASRFGALCFMPVWASLLTIISWRQIAMINAFLALVGSAIAFTSSTIHPRKITSRKGSHCLSRMSETVWVTF